MIRFVELGAQLHVDGDGPPEFAWFDTITDTFLSFCDAKVWETWDDFYHHFMQDRNAHHNGLDHILLDRLEGLYPVSREKPANKED